MDPASPSNSVVTGSVEDSSGEEDSDDDNDLPNAEQGGIQHNGNEAQEEEEEDNDEVRKLCGRERYIVRGSAGGYVLASRDVYSSMIFD